MTLALALAQGKRAKDAAFYCLKMAAQAERARNRKEADRWRARAATAFRSVAIYLHLN
jgi:hypothetical protein